MSKTTYYFFYDGGGKPVYTQMAMHNAYYCACIILLWDYPIITKIEWVSMNWVEWKLATIRIEYC